jgi:8-oxo-dGTP diphosphatase
MPQSDQNITPNRYTLIPRTIIFIRKGDEVLLLKGAETKKLWAGKYNGLGGHIEQGEDVISSAKRELYEEAGITADLRLCGTVIVDAGDIGICLFVICGENPQGEITESKEGRSEWIKKESINDLPSVEDLPILLNKIDSMNQNDPPFSARSFYEDGKLKIIFG